MFRKIIDLIDMFAGIDENDYTNVETNVGDVYEPYKDAYGQMRLKLIGKQK